MCRPDIWRISSSKTGKTLPKIQPSPPPYKIARIGLVQCKRQLFCISITSFLDDLEEMTLCSYWTGRPIEADRGGWLRCMPWRGVLGCPSIPPTTANWWTSKMVGLLFRHAASPCRETAQLSSTFWCHGLQWLFYPGDHCHNTQAPEEKRHNEGLFDSSLLPSPNLPRVPESLALDLCPYQTLLYYKKKYFVSKHISHCSCVAECIISTIYVDVCPIL